jgi:membrane-associated tyrosine- and threonine-specific cdc2-inhibitory kinase
LGEGSFGEVYKVRCKEDGKLYAVKKTRFHYKSEAYRRERMQEVRRYEEFSSNENCVTLYKAWEQDDILFMQIELCRGSVQDFVEEIHEVSEPFVWSFLLDMLLALKALHDKNLIHLDIKLDNILITDENHCKLADFGLVFDTVNTNHSRGTEGDSRYLAPELMEGKFCLSNDIFSLGISLLELACSLELPSNGSLWQELRKGILPEHAMNKFQLSHELQSIIRSMMNPDPANRPTVNELLDHPKLKEMNTHRRFEKIASKCVSILNANIG